MSIEINRIVLEKVSVDYVSKLGKYTSRYRALNNVSLEIKNGIAIAVYGPSGAGKTTLLRTIAGILKPVEGRVLWNDLDLYLLPEEKRCDLRLRYVGIIHQEPQLFDELTVLENVELPMTVLQVSKHERRSRAIEILRYLGISDEMMRRRPYQLPGGERRRVEIARAIAKDPQIVLADEPTAYLDKENAIKVMELLRREADKGKIVVIATHDPLVREYVDRVVELSYGEIVRIT